MQRRNYGWTAGLILLAACSNDGPDRDTAGGGTGGGIDTATPGPSTSDASGGGDTGMSSADSTAATEGASTGELNCGETTVVLQSVPPNVVLVLDKSGSMVVNSWDSDANPDTAAETRWRSLYDVVELVTTNFDTAINLGAVLFPVIDASADPNQGTACAVAAEPDVPVAPENAAEILATIPSGDSTTEIQGATPATAGIQTALDHLKTLDPTIPRFMILITDGAANCSATATDDQCGNAYNNCADFEVYDENLPLLVEQAYSEDNIPTFVVGIDIINAVTGGANNDGSAAANTFEALNVVAEAGGRARDGSEKFFNALNEIELEAALQEIAGQVVSCVIPLNPEPPNPNYVTIEIGGEVIERVTDCSTENGWVYTNPDGPYDAIELCGTACDALAQTGTFDAVYGCPPPA